MSTDPPDRPLKVLLVANYEPDRQRSMARYAELLCSGLNHHGHHAVILRPAPLLARLVGADYVLRRWLAYVDKFVLFPPLLRWRARRFDVVHVCDHGNSFYLRWTGGVPALITAHDALAIRSALGEFPENPTRATGVIFQRLILHNLRRAAHIVCVSEKTRIDFSTLLDPAPPMTVIPNVLSDAFHPATAVEISEARSACGLAPAEEYLVHIGKGVWYKNRLGLLRIFAELRKYPRFATVRLVVAGGGFSASMRVLAARIGGVVEHIDPSDDRLRALYTGALALLFPSLEEGFGWPILEAQACGCPVITSNRPPMAEVARNAAILIDPGDPVGAASTIAERIGEAAALRQAGFENLCRYDAGDAVERLCVLYRELIG